MAFLIKANVAAAPNSPFDVALARPLVRATPQGPLPPPRQTNGPRGALAIVWRCLPPIIIVRMYPRVRRDLALLRQLDHVHGRRVSPRPA
jgi:hypothetical protein